MLAASALLCSICAVAKTAILRARVDSKRKARVEKILLELGLTSTQAINIFFAQIERRKAIPFPLTTSSNADILPPLEQVARIWDGLDDADFSYLDKR
jgi:addiction module RelB/DinJ family antitoxin